LNFRNLRLLWFSSSLLASPGLIEQVNLLPRLIFLQAGFRSVAFIVVKSGGGTRQGTETDTDLLGRQRQFSRRVSAAINSKFSCPPLLTI
jgi:hypothetical protein